MFTIGKIGETIDKSNSMKMKPCTRFLRLLYIVSLMFVQRTTPLSFPSQYCVIERKIIEHGKVTSIFPKGWMRSIASNLDITPPLHSPTHKVRYLNRIKEIVWLPSYVSLSEVDVDDGFLDDEHFISQLAQHGLTVHSVQPKTSEKSLQALSETIKWRIKEGNVVPRQLAIIGQELSVLHVLNYLSEIALPMTADRIDVGAVIIIDPFSIDCLKTLEGRKAILHRYIKPLMLDELVMELKETLFPKSLLTERSKSKTTSKRKRINEDKNYNKEIIQSYLKRWAKLGVFGESLLYLLEEAMDRNASDRLPATRKEIKEIANGGEFLEMGEFTDLEFDLYENTEASRIPHNLFGSYPSQVKETASAMKNRILIISSLFPDPSTAISSNTPAWNAQSIEELSFLFKAEPVIYLENTQSHISTSFLNDMESNWKREDIARHQKLFDVISSWISMLTQFQYI